MSDPAEQARFDRFRASFAVEARRHPIKAAKAAAALAKKIAAGTADPLDGARLAGLLEGLRGSNHCGNCGKPLTDSVSVARGIGPDCFELMRWRGEAE